MCCPYRALTGSRKQKARKTLNSGQYSKNYSARCGSCTNGLLAPRARTHHHTFVLKHDALCDEIAEKSRYQRDRGEVSTCTAYKPALREITMSHISTFYGMLKRGLPAIMGTPGYVRVHNISNVARCTGLPRHPVSLLVCHVCTSPPAQPTAVGHGILLTIGGCDKVQCLPHVFFLIF